LRNPGNKTRWTSRTGSCRGVFSGFDREVYRKRDPSAERLVGLLFLARKRVRAVPSIDISRKVIL
jgi:hypothetical protein